MLPSFLRSLRGILMGSYRRNKNTESKLAATFFFENNEQVEGQCYYSILWISR